MKQLKILFLLLFVASICFAIKSEDVDSNYILSTSSPSYRVQYGPGFISPAVQVIEGLLPTELSPELKLSTSLSLIEISNDGGIDESYYNKIIAKLNSLKGARKTGYAFLVANIPTVNWKYFTPNDLELWVNNMYSLKESKKYPWLAGIRENVWLQYVLYPQMYSEAINLGELNQLFKTVYTSLESSDSRTEFMKKYPKDNAGNDILQPLYDKYKNSRLSKDDINYPFIDLWTNGIKDEKEAITFADLAKKALFKGPSHYTPTSGPISPKALSIYEITASAEAKVAVRGSDFAVAGGLVTRILGIPVKACRWTMQPLADSTPIWFPLDANGNEEKKYFDYGAGEGGNLDLHYFRLTTSSCVNNTRSDRQFKQQGLFSLTGRQSVDFTQRMKILYPKLSLKTLNVKVVREVNDKNKPEVGYEPVGGTLIYLYVQWSIPEHNSAISNDPLYQLSRLFTVDDIISLLSKDLPDNNIPEKFTYTQSGTSDKLHTFSLKESDLLEEEKKNSAFGHDVRYVLAGVYSTDSNGFVRIPIAIGDASLKPSDIKDSRDSQAQEYMMNNGANYYLVAASKSTGIAFIASDKINLRFNSPDTRSVTINFKFLKDIATNGLSGSPDFSVT